MKRQPILTSMFCSRHWPKLSMLTFVLLGAVTVRADDDLPKRFNFDRYQGMLDRSPFAVASAVAPPVVTPDVFKALYVANAARLPEGAFVTIMSSDDKNLKEYLSTGGPNEHGYAIASIEWSDRPGETKVTISKDGKFGTLNFNQSLLISTMPNAPTAGQSQPLPQPVIQPGAPGVNLPKPGRLSPLATPTPHVRGVIQRNPIAATPQPAPER
jgi:hypothetical protein